MVFVSSVGAHGPGLESLGRAAASAVRVVPSMPWLVAIGSGGIEIRLDRERLGQARGDWPRLVDVGCGAVAFSLRLALRRLGSESVTYLARRPADPDLLAVLRIGGRTPRAARRAGSAPAGAPCATAALQLLAPDAADEGTGLVVLEPAVALSACALVDEAAWELGVVPPEWTALSAAGRTAALAVIGTADDSRADRLRAGQALQRVVLAAERQGLDAYVLTMPWECEATVARACAMVPGPLGHAQALLLFVSR